DTLNAVVRLLHHASEHTEIQFELVRKVRVDGALRQPHRGGDGVDRRSIVAARGEGRGCGTEERGASPSSPLFLAHPCPASRQEDRGAACWPSDLPPATVGTPLRRPRQPSDRTGSPSNEVSQLVR